MSDAVLSFDRADSQCRAWTFLRKDGVAIGFTNHDMDLEVGGVLCRAASGLDGVAIERSSGLSVDNSEAIGALSSDAIRDGDISAGLYDGAEVRVWSVDWSAPGAAELAFKGTLGQITRVDGEFRAELRGLSEALNKTTGRVFKASCNAVLGDAACGVDLDGEDFSTEAVIEAVNDGNALVLTGATKMPERWFERGVLRVVGDSAQRQVRIKSDKVEGARRHVTLWQTVPDLLSEGAQVVLVAGCDKAISTCRDKFDNVVNFRGFPTIPGEDWMISYPSSNQIMDGGRR